ncbi:MAG TPA: O-antigen ligase family protein [Planctomycetota bacterium]|nr:O-antigen ligase family protein [Planctomycetota bacterium]HRR78697.1 O-antigen ligase family protein [Planctomycetota bacterium]HRT93365.1 O-antigen ligase family protein [Planctomycetota bacterium]
MGSRLIPIDEVDPPQSRLDAAIHWTLVALLLFLPLAFGTVQAWSEFVYVAGAGVLGLCFALKLLVQRDVAVVRTWAYAPILLTLLLAVVQLIPLPTGLVRVLSPNTAAMKAQLLADLSGEGPRAMALSFYAQATRHDLRLLLAAAVVFAVVLNVYRHPDQIKRLLASAAAIGGGIALLALAQNVFGNGRIYWTYPTYGNVAASGPFVCHSHYGQFMNLSIGAALALLFVRLHESFGHGPVRFPEVVERLSSPELRVVWYLAAMVVLGAATLFLSLTRGGMVSLLIAGGFTGLVTASRRTLRGRGLILTGLALSAFAVVLYIGFDAVYDRLATLRGLHGYGGRWEVVKNLAVSFTRFPLAGTGLGTHQVVYPMFDRSMAPDVASHAENEYAQAAEEMGVLGLGLLLAFLAIVGAAYIRSVRRLRFPIRSAALGLGFGLMAILVHSFSDFGQHLPANHCLAAISCALLLNIARVGHTSRSDEGARTGLTASPILRAVPLLAIAGIWTWSLAGSIAAWRAEERWARVTRLEAALRKKNWQGTNEDYVALLKEAEAAVAAEPDNIEYQYWLGVYRWRSISRITNPKTGEMLVSKRHARRIVAELNQARALCPTYGPAYSTIGQIEKFVLGDPSGADRIRLGHKLAPYNPTACYLAGLVDALEGDHEASLEKFQRCLQAEGGSFRAMADVYLHQVSRPDLAVILAGDDVGRLLYVADALHEMPDQQELATAVREQVSKARAAAVQALKTQCDKPGVSPATLAAVAAIWRQEKNPRAAIECYRRALALDYGQVGWRMELAQLLAEAGHVSEARHEARVCLRLRPQLASAQKLLESLSVLPDAPDSK